MALCPHCNREGISGLAKWRSGSSAPIPCQECKGLSYVTTSDQTDIYSKSALLGWAAAVAAFITADIWVAVAGAGLALLYYAYRWQRAALVGVTAEQAAQNRIWGWSFYLGILALFVIIGTVRGWT
jgi:hypothetical protein